jgi:hypothetical protein
MFSIGFVWLRAPIVIITVIVGICAVAAALAATAAMTV